MDDLISRSKAIRWVKTECNPYGKPTLEFESGKRVIEHLEQMPSAQPERTRWISCAELLPGLDEEVLATTAWGDITIAWRIGIDKWFIHEGNTNATTSDLVAWMLLPELYKEKNDGEDRE